MLQDLQTNVQIHLAEGNPIRKIHFLRDMESEYQQSLATLCDIESFPNVIYKIAHDSLEMYKSQPSEYRKFKYTVLDSNHFERIKME